ncbi:MHC class II transactivator isoform X3 [Marmota monax]|uniref:MHC class II transactivator isoform X3 n=1 Tax=Marmota monax TaxID=9995 RepID=UPI001EB04B1C|nr:MHC class II transactivator isoform X3 [Marmota monax]KAI6054199.1 CIITA [Marmota monax]KAI6066212.1 CIITA [Marmota monax]
MRRLAPHLVGSHLPEPQGSGHCAMVDPGPLEGGYLELLNSSADPLHLYHFYDQMDLAAEEETEPGSEPDADTINCDQFSRLLCDMEGDEETREAYAHIAELDQYVFQDSQLEGLSRDLFMEHIGLDGVLGEGLEVPAEPGPRSQKRPLSEEHPADLKHRKLAEAPAVPIVTGSFLVGPASDPASPPGLQAALFNQEPASSQIHPEKAVQMPEPPPTASASCLHLPAGPIQLMSTLPTLPTLPQGLWPISGAGTGLCSILICPGETPLTSQAPPSTGPAVHSLPKSPDRPGSTSPFAPSAADLPSMPEPALTARTAGTEDKSSPCQAAPEVSTELPKWPETVRRFQEALRDQYQAARAGREGIAVEVDLVSARLEKGSNKSQERELATPDWAERQLARGGLAGVLAAAGHRRRPRETLVMAVLGKAGQGKSHWARAAGVAWAGGQLPQYDFVFYASCRGLDRPGDTYHLRELLCSLGPRPLALDDEVFRHLLRRPDRVLLALDALEELEAQDGGPGGPPTAERGCRGLLAGLLQGQLLRGCTLLLTARPRGRLAQSLSKAHALFEVAGFSGAQAQDYTRRYFETSGATGHPERALALLRGRPFLLAHSHSPAVCRAVCQLSEALLAQGDQAQLPPTLTGLYVGLLGPVARGSPPGALAGLAKLAWEMGRTHQGTLREGQFPSAEARTWAVAGGLVRPVPGTAGGQLAFSSFVLQCFLGALWLALSGDIKDKELPQYLALTPRKKRPYDNWLEAAPRFLSGLIFQPQATCLGALVAPAEAASVDRKRRALARYLRRLQPGSLRARRLLELLHCAHEAQEAALWQHVAQELPARLGLLGARLAPADAFVLGQALSAAGRDFSLDLRSTGIDPSGLESLVGLASVTRFRAALSDTMGLWESLQQRGETRLLQAAEDKFTIEPFKAKSLKDVQDLESLVQTQRLRSSSEEAPGTLPAVRDLKKLEFALGPSWGPQAFPRLAKILPAFSSLQHLDLDSLSENKIGDEGVSQLSATFPQLKALETLNLSQNSITDVGACKLAAALPSLATTLLRLSLYNNCICDLGAESLARALPEMASLRVLDVQYNKFTAAGAQQLASSLRKCPHVETLAMWTPTIPFGVQEHLQQLDSRISLR